MAKKRKFPQSFLDNSFLSCPPLSFHVQTLSGDHGGGSPDETDSLLLAFNLHKWWRRRRQRQEESSSSKAEPMAEAAGVEGSGAVDGAAAEEAGGEGLHQETDRAGPNTGGQEELDSLICPTGRSEAMASERLAWLADHPENAYSTAQGGDAGAQGGGAEGLLSRCYSGVMPQVDFAASLAVSLGLPIPFGSVGKVDPSWWRMAAAEEREEEEEAGGEKGWMSGYERVLRLNAWQVRFSQGRVNVTL